VVNVDGVDTDWRASPWADGATLILVAVAYFLAHSIALLLPDAAKELTAIGPAGGIGLAALLLNPRRLWPAIVATLFVAGCSADLLAGRSALVSLGFSTANLIESLSCAWCLRRWCGERIRFVRIREISALAFVATVLNGLTACLGAGLAVFPHGAGFLDSWRTWSISHGIGIVLLTPLIVTWLGAGDAPGEIQRAQRAERDRIFEWFLFLVLWIGGSWVSFARGFGERPILAPHPYMLVLLLAWPSSRFGQRTVSLALTILAVIAISSKAVTVGPLVWGGDSFLTRLLKVQMFLGFTGVLAYLLNASFSETRASLNALRESENSYRTLVDQASEAIFIADDKGRYVDVNARACTLLGYARQDLLRMGPADVVLPEDMAARPIGYAALAAGEQVVVERRLRRKDGTNFIAEISGIMLSDRRYQGIVRDISERKRMQETLRQSEEKYRSLFNNAEVGMFRTRVDGSEVLDFNDKYAEIFGRTREEMLGSSSVKYWADPEERLALVDRLKSDGRVSDCECRMLSRDGQVKRCLASARLYPEQGILEGSIIDISAWKRAEVERLNLEQQLAKSQRLESLGLLAGGIAHDFNNLMGAIYGHIELALDGALDVQAKEDLSRAMVSMGRARDLTRQLLTFAKGGAPMRKLGPLFPFVEECTRLALSDGRVTSTFDVQPGLWASNFDQSQLAQVISNLVVNAQEAISGTGAIRVTARNAKLLPREAATLSAGDYVIISIEDDGMGIPSEALPRVFDPFFSTKEQGRGLGLTACHSIMKRHDGTITVESIAGKGSTFRLYLPAVTASGDIRPRQDPTARHRGVGRVLVMDDDGAVRDVLSAMLKSLGYAVEAVSDGGVAVAAFAREAEASRPFCAALLDLTIPGGLGGKDAAQEIRALDSDVPLFVTSGYAEDPVMADPTAYGFKASLRKPFVRSELSELLERYLGRDRTPGIG
jgi:PAS domain S-box-containing protein